MKSLENANLDFEREILTEEQKYNEYILTNLRTKWGLDENQIIQRFSLKISDFFQKEVKKHQKDGFLIQNQKLFKLTNKGQFLADRIASDLFYI